MEEKLAKTMADLAPSKFLMFLGGALILIVITNGFGYFPVDLYMKIAGLAIGVPALISGTIMAIYKEIMKAKSK